MVMSTCLVGAIWLAKFHEEDEGVGPQ